MKKLIFALFVLSFLSACGGGGGGEDIQKQVSFPEENMPVVTSNNPSQEEDAESGSTVPVLEEEPPLSEPYSGPEPEFVPDAVSENPENSGPASDPVLNPGPAPEPVTYPVPDSEPEFVPDAASENPENSGPASDPVPDPKPTPKPVPDPVPDPKPTPKPVPDPVPDPEPDPVPKPNQPPTSTSLEIVVEEDSFWLGKPLVVDPDDDTHKVEALTLPEHGTLRVYPTGAFEYFPNPNYNGSDSFRYKAIDSEGLFVEGVAKITVIPVNDPPSGVTDVFVSVDEDTTGTFSFEVRDIDVGDSHTFEIVSNALNGNAVSNGKTVSYTPNKDYFGEDYFVLRIIDSGGLFVDQRIIVDVNPVDDPIVRIDDTYIVVDEDSGLTCHELNIVDPDGPPLDFFGRPGSYSAKIQFMKDIEMFFDRKSLCIIPFFDLNGEFYTELIVSDGIVEKTARVYITVTPVNDPPLASDVSVFAETETQVIITPEVSDIDEQDTYTVDVSLAPQNGTVSVSSDGKSLLYTSNAEFLGQDEFVYIVTDSGGATATAKATVNVTPKIYNIDPLVIENSSVFWVKTAVYQNKIAAFWADKYISTGGSLNVSFSYDEGQTFEPSGFVASGFYPEYTFVDDAGTVYVFMFNGSWLMRNVGFTSNWQYVVAPFGIKGAFVDGQGIYVTNSGGFAVSFDESASWQIKSRPDEIEHYNCKRNAFGKHNGVLHIIFGCQTSGIQYMSYDIQNDIFTPAKKIGEKLSYSSIWHPTKGKIYLFASCLHYPYRDSKGDIYVLRSCDNGDTWENVFVAPIIYGDLSNFEPFVIGAIGYTKIPHKVWFDTTTGNILALQESEYRSGYMNLVEYQYDSLSGNWNSQAVRKTDIFSPMWGDIRSGALDVDIISGKKLYFVHNYNGSFVYSEVPIKP